MKKQFKLYSSKVFLDTESQYEHGAICSGVNTEYNDTIIEAYLRVSDCSRNVQLDFSLHSEAEYRKRMKKLDTLIHELWKFKAQMQEAYEATKNNFVKENDV